jgi:hypothetical protein
MSQRKYLVLFRNQPGGPTQRQGEPPSPEQMQKMYAVFNAWKEKFKDQLLDLGTKLQPGGKVVRASGVADGPFVEGKEIIGGYMIVGADDYEGACQVAAECLAIHGTPGGSMEVREMAAF